MSNIKYPLGVIPSPEDKRDYPVTSIIPMTSYPEEFCYEIKHIRDQGSVGSCVAETLAAIKEQQENKEHKKYQKYSANFIYGNRREDQYQGEGMYPREALIQLRDYGVCREELMPGRVEYPQQKHLFNDKLFEDAKPQVIQFYGRIYNSNEVKNTIYNDSPAMIVVPVYLSFFLCPKDGNLPLPNTATETLYGYHAMTIIGYTKDKYIIQNSWGNSWGKDGICYMPFNYPITEMWSVTDYIKSNEPRVVIEMWLNKKDYKINNINKTMDVEPYLDTNSNRTFVPLRFISEGLGAKVDWYSTNQSISIQYRDKTLIMFIGKNEMLVNGKSQIIDAPPVLLNARTFVPLRAIVELLDCKVDWIASENKIVITSY